MRLSRVLFRAKLERVSPSMLEKQHYPRQSVMVGYVESFLRQPQYNLITRETVNLSFTEVQRYLLHHQVIPRLRTENCDGIR